VVPTVQVGYVHLIVWHSSVFRLQHVRTNQHLAAGDIGLVNQRVKPVSVFPRGREAHCVVNEQTSDGYKPLLGLGASV
jgi:hypothetical protein